MKFEKGNKINLGRRQSEETRNKISKVQLGKKLSQKTKDKISKALKGRKPYIMTDEIKKKISEKTKKAMANLSPEIKSKIAKNILGRTPWNKGKKGIFKMSEETKIKMRKSHKGKHTGEKCNWWKGGVTPGNESIRKSIEYKLWRKSVFERDKYTCVWCGLKSGNGKAVVLHADHIKPFYLYPELRFAIDNGRTLCIECHMKTKTWGRPHNNK